MLLSPTLCIPIGNFTICEIRLTKSDYEKLKHILKKTNGNEFNEANEEIFITSLENELEKISTFCLTKSNELAARVQYREASIDDIFRADEIAPDRLYRTEDEMNRITSDVTELASFIRLNYSGFVKVQTL